jgi:hypothetical protein
MQSHKAAPCNWDTSGYKLPARSWLSVALDDDSIIRAVFVTVCQILKEWGG